MDIRNCKSCGKIYVFDNFDICPKCRRENEKYFEKVKKYINENPGANISEVSKETEVSERKIIAFLKEGRLELKDADNTILLCERCGKSIRTGRFCKKCIFEMDREFKQVIGKARDVSEIGENGVKEKIKITERYNTNKKK